MIYIASPYSHKDKEVVRRRYWVTAQFTFAGIRQDMPLFSPILHCHDAAQLLNVPTDSKFWGSYNKNMLTHSSHLVVLGLPDWEDSIGVEMEVKAAEEMQVPVYIYTVDNVQTDFTERFLILWESPWTRFKRLQSSVVGKYKVLS
jgi:hypothetical protein